MERLDYLARNLAWVFVVGAMVGLLPAGAPAAISIDLVTVADLGNAGELSGDGSGGYGPPRVCGAVPYLYQIGTYEVTSVQYRAFLNSVARYGDPYKLYAGRWGIERTGTGAVGDPYVYVTRDGDPNWETKPANYVSWYNSLRFINWLQNGQPMAEAGAGVTETGTYTFSDPSTVSIPDHGSITTPTWVLPTEDEWYKSAYYKGGGTAAGYWDYATQSDTLPDNNPPWEDTGNSANYHYIDLDDPNAGGDAVGWPYYTTDVGEYALSEGAYGTYDQNGNVAEVLENHFDYDLEDRQIRGGSWQYYQDGLTAFHRFQDIGPEQAVPDVGFRVALVPEPGTLGLLLLGGLGLLPRRTGKGR